MEKETKVLCLNTTLRFMLGDFECSIVNAHEIVGHDDSQPYSAELFVNGKRIAGLLNDGWGGNTLIEPEWDCKDLIDTLNELAKKETYKFGVLKNRNFDSLDEICDNLVYNYFLWESVTAKHKPEDYLFVLDNNTQAVKMIKLIKPFGELKKMFKRSFILENIEKHISSDEILINANMGDLAEYIIS